MTLRWRAPTNDGGEPITHYEYEQDGSGTWISTGSTDTSHTVTGLNNGQTYTFRVRAVNALGNGAVVTLEATPSPPTGGGGGGGPRITAPSAPRNLLAGGGDGQVTLTWEAPEDDGGSAITDYEVRIDGKGRWISIGSTDTTHTVSWCAAPRQRRGCSPEWPWSSMPVTGSSPRYRWCRFQRGCLRNR